VESFFEVEKFVLWLTRISRKATGYVIQTPATARCLIWSWVSLSTLAGGSQERYMSQASWLWTQVPLLTSSKITCPNLSQSLSIYKESNCPTLRLEEGQKRPQVILWTGGSQTWVSLGILWRTCENPKGGAPSSKCKFRVEPDHLNSHQVPRWYHR
jgi:hypothetical protein